MFDAVAEGVLLAKYINKIRPGAIMEKKLATKPRNTFEISQNHVLTLEAAKEIGLKIVNIGPTDLITKTPHLVLGLTWQLIRLGLLDKVSVAKQPGLVALLEPGEDVNALISLTPEETLLRWFNYHLRRAGHHRHVHNFTTDIQDSENYLVLLNQINPDLCVLEAMQESDPLKRAEHMLHNAAKLDCNKFVTPHEVVTGHKKLNLAFVANLFNRHAGLQTLEQDAERQRLQKEAEEAQKRRLAEEEEARKRAWEAEQEMWRKRMKEEEARRQAELAEWERKQKEAEAEEARRRAWEAEQTLLLQQQQQQQQQYVVQQTFTYYQPTEPWTEKVTFRSHHGRYLCAELKKGRVVADRDKALAWEQWIVVHKGDKVTLMSAHGKYLCAEKDGTLVADRDVAKEWEHFQLQVRPDGRWVLMSHHGKYVCAEDKGKKFKVIANRNKADMWEEWLVTRV